MEIKDYIELIDGMIKDDSKRDAMFMRIDNIFRMKWELPKEIKELGWVKEFISTDGHDALRSVARIFSSRSPDISVWPASADIRDREKAQWLERGLRWYAERALVRGEFSPLNDIIMSAARYDEICGQIIYLPRQEQFLKGLGGNAHRKAAMLANGPFAVVIRNPRQVHTHYSEFGAEAVVYVGVTSAKGVVAFWGERAKEIQTLIDANKASPFYTIYDYSDFEKKLVIAVPCTQTEVVNLSAPDKKRGVIEIVNDANDLDFLPWICHVGGTSLEGASEDRRIPMLYSVDRAKQFETQNIIQSLSLSEAIAHSAAPRGKKSGPGSENIQVEYGSPTLDVVVGPGQDYTRLASPELDDAMFKLNEWVAGKIEKSTVPRAMQGGNIPSEVFSTLNLAIQSGMVTVDPYRKLAERWVSSMCIQMLQWVANDGKTLKAYSKKRDDQGREEFEIFQIDPKEFELTDLRIDVLLQADVPVDRLQKINGAAMMVKSLNYPTGRALEEIGETDSEGAMRERVFETLRDFIMNRQLQKISAQDQLEIQAAQAKMQMEMQQASQAQGMMQQQQMQQQQMQMQQQQVQGQQESLLAQGAGATQGPQPGTPPGAQNPDVSGQQFNPAAGGLPASATGPVGFEQQTGMTRGGQAVA